MRVGITIGHTDETAADIARLAALAEGSGHTAVGFPDSQSIFRDTYCALTAGALATREVALVTAMTNVTTRHPIVTAGAIATVNELSGGRALLGIGTGASSVSNLGLKPAKASELREAIKKINLGFDQALGEAEPGDKAILLKWPKSRVPVICGASINAARAMRVAAECADGVMLIGGVDQATIADRIAQMHAIRSASARAGDPFQVWLYAAAYVDEDSQVGRATIAGTVLSMGVLTVEPTLEDYGVPEALRPNLRTLKARYDYRSHSSPVGSLDLLDTLGLSDWLFAQLTIGGAANEVATQLKGLEDVGVNGVLMGGYVPDKLALIARVGEVCSLLN